VVAVTIILLRKDAAAGDRSVTGGSVCEESRKKRQRKRRIDG
jgi:hypothetical protein